MAGEKTRYPFPPECDVWTPFPSAVPWDAPISEMGWWLAIECVCGHTTKYPLRLLAANVGWKRTLRTTVPKLRCSNCDNRPSRICLEKDGTGESIRAYYTAPKPLVLWEDGHLTG